VFDQTPPTNELDGPGERRWSEVGRAPVARWLTWLLGGAIVAAVVVAAFHVSEGRAFLRLAARARPWWLVVAVLAQAATYFFQGGIWRIVVRAGGASLTVRTAYELTVARLFMDQALPSAGLSGTVLTAKALELRGVPRRVVMAGVAVDTASCYVTYAVGLVVALVITLFHHQANHMVMVVSGAFLPFAIALSAGFLALSGRPPGRLARRLERLRPLARGLAWLAAADPRLARSPSLLARACARQAIVLLLDVATVWALIAALGARAAPAGVFASYMISTMFRLVGVMPGGLGAFEASSTLTLRMVGVDLPVALSATLLYRGLSFWLPFAPGIWLSRRFGARPPRERR
jgi:Mg2+-importing ATPase